MKISKLLENLNTRQLQAVKHKNGPLLIIAGAGTGKTTVITKRIAYLIAKRLAKPEEILALTFTEKAATEMEERVDVLLPYGYVNTQISTFHSFGQSILTEFAFDLGINTDFKTLTQEDQQIFFNEHLYSFDLKHFRPGSNPIKYISNILNFFSRCKDELLTPKDIIKYAKNIKDKSKKEEDKIVAEKYLELANAYKKYQELLEENELTDFGDQINLVIKLLKENPSIRKKLQSRFKYILVDEFQDTNIAQNELIKLLTNKDENVTIVGDDDQSIYKFRGASISNIMHFTKSYKKTKIIVLNENYRSSQEILDCAYRLIQHNNPDRLEIKHNINKKLKSQLDSIKPLLKTFSDHYAEAKWIAKDIQSKLTNQKKLKYKDIAIITRSNKNYEHIVNSLKAANIPNITSSSISLYETPTVQICVNLIKAITQPTNSLALFQILTSSIYNIETWEMAKISGFAKQKNRPIIQIIENIDSYQDEFSTSQRIKDKLLLIIDEFKKLSELAKTKSTREFLYYFLTEKNYLKKILSNENSGQNLVNLFKKIEDFEKVTLDKTIYNYSKYLDQQLETGATFDQFEHYEINAVNILTAHSSKGLEFDTVYLPTLTSDYFPTRERKDPIEIPQELIKETLPEKDHHLEEERRLFYVSITRAKNNLILSYAKNYGGIRTKKASPFITESLDINLKQQEIIKSALEDKIQNTSTQQNLFDFAKKEYQKIKLNAHKIDDYLTCPLKYYYVHELKLPISKNQSVVYGSAIHKAIEFFLKSIISGKKPTIENIVKVFESNWDSEGFMSIKQEEERKNQGIKALKNFYKKNINIGPQIEFIEKPFSFQFSTKTKITGRYDIVLKNNDKIEIGDFKTSNITSQSQANSRIRNSRQMLMYALSFFKEYGKLPDKLSLKFIGNDFEAILIPKQKHLEKISTDISKTQKGIVNQNFSAKPSKFTCSFCAYKTICPKKAKGA